MDSNILQQLTSTELDQYANELEHALESHNHWLGRVNRALVLGTDYHPDDLAAEPHRLCHFGRWYHNLEEAELQGLHEFAAMGRVHADVHQQARELLNRRQNGQPIEAETYDDFNHRCAELRHLIHSVRNGIRHNLAVASHLMGKVFENATEGVVITAPDGTILNVNRAFSEVTGYSAEEAIGQTPHLLYSGRQPADFYKAMWEALNTTGQWQGEIWNKRKNGDIYLEWLTISQVKNDRGEATHYVGIFTDITTEKANEERLYHLAHYDPLTELPNRVLFQDRFKQAIARARRGERKIAVMFLDLDGFKEVNDQFGHNAGDELLSQVARRLAGLLRESDTVARLGGDEFAIILPDLYETSGLIAVAEKVISTVASPFRLEGGHLAHITTSVGISMYPRDGMDSDNLIQRADLAMYEAKKSGKNRWRFYDRAAMG